MRRRGGLAARTALGIAAAALGACAAPTYRIATTLPSESVAHPVQVIDARPAETRVRRPLHDVEGRALPAQVLGDADVAVGKLALLAHYLGSERAGDEPDTLRVTRLDLTLWYPTASGGGFSLGAGGSHGFAGAGAYSAQPVLGDALVLSLRGDYGDTRVEVELREPLAQGVTRNTREPNRPEQVRPVFARAARQVLEQYRRAHPPVPVDAGAP